MPYTTRQKQAAGAELARRAEGGKRGDGSGIRAMSLSALRHMASRASGTRKKGR